MVAANAIIEEGAFVDGEFPVLRREVRQRLHGVAHEADRQEGRGGRQSLRSGGWEAVPEGQAGTYNFFKVTVEMKAQ